MAGTGGPRHVQDSHTLPSRRRTLVEPAAVSLFAAWSNFYVIIGSSAAALTGLQFVVIALAADAPAARGPEGSPALRELGVAYSTPTILHLCAFLLIRPFLSKPYQRV